MPSKFSDREAAEYYRNRCAQQSRELTRLKTEKGLEAYRKKCEMQADERNKELKADVRAKDCTINKLTRELEAVSGKLERKREENEALISDNLRLQAANEGLSKDLKKAQQLSGADADEITNLRSENEKLQKQHEEDAKKILELEKQVISLGGDVEKLKHQQQRDSHNSSKPTSQNAYVKPVQNNRQKTDKPQGAQEGHKPQPRKVVEIPGKLIGEILGESDPLWNNPDYSFVDYTVKHVYSSVVTVIDQYVLVPRFRNVKTGAWAYAEHPSWVNDEVNYSPSAKAMILYLNLCCNMAINKCQSSITDFSHGLLRPSTGFIAELTEEFALKSEPERALAFSKMLGPSVLNVDGTTIRMDGVQYNITICVSGEFTLYFFRPTKGEKGVKGTPIEHTIAILVHDHDVTYYNYGTNHQECLEHVCRYLKDSIEMEKDMTWNVKMLNFLQELMKATKEEDKKNAQDPGTESKMFGESTNVEPRFTKELREKFTAEFKEICRVGLEEYEKNPPNKYYTSGMNLCKRLGEDPESYLYFLENKEVPYTNNTAEQKAREIKRKLAVAMSFRGLIGVVSYLEAQSVIQILKKTNSDVLSEMTSIMSREVSTEDKLRQQRAQEGFLVEMIEKDETAIKRLTDQRDEAQKTLDQCSAEEQTAYQDYLKEKKQRIEDVGENADPSEEEKRLQNEWETKQSHTYQARVAFNALKDKLEKRTKTSQKNRKDLDETRERIAALEKKANDEPTKPNQDATKKENETEQQPYRVIDSEEVKAAEAEVAEKEKLYKEVFNRVDQAAIAYNDLICPLGPIMVSPSVAKMATKDEEKVSIKDTEEALKAQEAYAKAQEELQKALEELIEAQKRLDKARKGRKPGRRNRKKGNSEAGNNPDKHQAAV